MYEFGRWGYGTSNSHCTVGNLIFFSLHIEVVGAFNRFVNHLRLLVIDLLDCLQTSQTLEPFQRQAHHVNPASIYQLFWRATAHGTSLRPVFYRLSVLTRMLVACCRANTSATLSCSRAQLDTLWPLFRLSLVEQWRSSLRLDQRFSERHHISRQTVNYHAISWYSRQHSNILKFHFLFHYLADVDGSRQNVRRHITNNRNAVRFWNRRDFDAMHGLVGTVVNVRRVRVKIPHWCWWHD